MFAQIDGEHSVQEDLAAVNPNFGSGLHGYTHNCGNCVVAYEMRRRGFDVEANPRKEMEIADWRGLFEGFTPQIPLNITTADVVAEIEQAMLQWGEGARGTVFGNWEEEVEFGHFFSAEVVQGRVMFVDGQNGIDDAKIYFYMMKPLSLIFGRLDNLKPTDAIKNAVKNKEA